MILLPKQICWGIKVVDGVKVANQLTLKEGDFPGLSKWSQYKSLKMEARRKRVSVRVMSCETLLAIAGSTDRSRHKPSNAGSL